MIKIIGFSGKAGSGKDTSAEIIKNMYRLDPRTAIYRLSFSKILKRAVKILFNLTEQQLYDRILKEKLDARYNYSPRYILQYIGTDVIRQHFGQDFFVNRLSEEIDYITRKHKKAMFKRNALIMITDVRFDNEAEMILRSGGIVVDITRDTEQATDNRHHASENGISRNLVSYTIFNNNTLSDLKFKLNLIIKSYKSGTLEVN
jgi:hypothetical protein